MLLVLLVLLLLHCPSEEGCLDDLDKIESCTEVCLEGVDDDGGGVGRFCRSLVYSFTYLEPL